MTIITSADFPAVRGAIDVTLTSTEISDTVIALRIYQGAAERYVISIDPLAESRTGDDLESIKSAVIYRTAALLCPAVPQLVQAGMGQLSYRRHEIDWEKRADYLMGLADDELADVVGEDAVAVYTMGSSTTVRQDGYSDDLDNVEL